MPDLRYRTRTGRHWRTASLTHLTHHPDETGELIADVVDVRTGNSRTLDTARHLLEIKDADGDDWQPAHDWAQATPSLFKTEATR